MPCMHVCSSIFGRESRNGRRMGEGSEPQLLDSGRFRHALNNIWLSTKYHAANGSRPTMCSLPHRSLARRDEIRGLPQVRWPGGREAAASLDWRRVPRAKRVFPSPDDLTAELKVRR
jgi:hypothetical protein